jgi:Transmembrane secretion effector
LEFGSTIAKVVITVRGALHWQLWRDTGDSTRFIEQFVLESWREHLRQHEGVTVSDQEVEQQVWLFHKGDGPPTVSHVLSQ